ncbi:MAG: hypothetical protein LBI34_00590 [Puniceicoccales bacterium]|jgi:hypothetical protein|nr:hypothetical protein [Puniceicoccales bacterium]
MSNDLTVLSSANALQVFNALNSSLDTKIARHSKIAADTSRPQAVRENAERCVTVLEAMQINTAMIAMGHICGSKVVVQFGDALGAYLSFLMMNVAVPPSKEEELRSKVADALIAVVSSVSAIADSEKVAAAERARRESNDADAAAYRAESAKRETHGWLWKFVHAW